VDKPTINAQTVQPQTEANINDWNWPFWPVVPLYPYGKRRTLRREVIKDTIWTFDQLQGILYVTVPIRMTVVRLQAGGLLVYSPVAPTPECIHLVQELVAEHGDVKYILLSTVTGIEHKVFVGPFARCFPTAQVYVAPYQWSFPLNLPLSWLGFPPKRTHFLPTDPHNVPFANEFDYALLGPIDLRLGAFAEVVLFHKPSQTLLVTDTVLSVPNEPPAIVQLDPYPLLFHARDRATDIVEDTAANRRKGWQRIALFSFYFRPSALTVSSVRQTLRDATQAADRSRKGYFGLFPFQWQPNWQYSFEALRGGGRLFVAPILQTLILDQAPDLTLDWVDRVASWNFRHIIPCHFDAPIDATPQQFRQAFAFLQSDLVIGSNGQASLPAEDFQFLLKLERKLHKVGLAQPAGDKGGTREEG
jgi:hypothetical protein